MDRVRRSEARTPDVRATKKKLGRYMRNNPADKKSIGKKKKDNLRDTQPLELEVADADFQTLLRVEWENDGSGRVYDDPPMSRMSAMSGATGFSGMSGMTAKSALSEGSQLRWKTGSLRRRKEKVRSCEERSDELIILHFVVIDDFRRFSFLTRYHQSACDSLRSSLSQAQQFRDDWVEGTVGGPDDTTTANDNWVQPGQAKIDYVPF